MKRTFRILVIDEWIPLPANIGKKIRTYNLLKLLSKNYNVNLLCFADVEKEKKYICDLENVGIHVIPVQEQRSPRGSVKYFLELFINQFSCLPFSVSYHYKSALLQKFKEVIEDNNYDLIHFEWTQMAIYLKHVKISQPVVISAHNVEAMIWKRYYINSKNIIEKFFYYFQMKKMCKYEKWAYNIGNYITAVSENDAEIIKNNYGQKNIVVVPNGVDIDYYKNTDMKSFNNRILFFGAMDYKANIDAVEFFLYDVMPLLIDKMPDLEFFVVGRNPPERLVALSKTVPYLKVTGTVEDIRPYYNKNSIFVAPLRLGAGTRLKIIEAMAMEVAVISTTIGAESLKCENGINILIADTPEDIRDKIIDLSNNRQLKTDIEQAGRKLVEKHYDWKQIAEIQNALWGSLIKLNTSLLN